MEFERPLDSKKITDPLGNEVTILGDSFVEADGDFLPLCSMCKKSRMTCENVGIRQVPDPREPLRYVEFLLDEGTVHKAPVAKMIDGVEAGIIKCEDDIPIPLMCMWFDMKELG